MAIPPWLSAADRGLIEFARRTSLPALRIALGLVFVWFGALKLAGVSPVADLVADAIPWLPAPVAVPGLGVVEILMGLGLLTGYAIRVTLLLFTLQMVGTFATFVLMPDRMFSGGNPLLLTTEGEFVVKNVVLLTAGLVIVSAVPRSHGDESLGRMLTEKPVDTMPPADRRGGAARR
jgi:uncharacterized membrane protein YkgB